LLVDVLENIFLSGGGSHGPPPTDSQSAGSKGERTCLLQTSLQHQSSIIPIYICTSSAALVLLRLVYKIHRGY